MPHKVAVGSLTEQTMLRAVDGDLYLAFSVLDFRVVVLFSVNFPSFPDELVGSLFGVLPHLIIDITISPSPEIFPYIPVLPRGNLHPARREKSRHAEPTGELTERLSEEQA